MLETINLVKTYKPKKGVPVQALDGVTLKFPETGMVFLLGKSGSGKSTLLNVLGGLDKYNSGEIIIKGVSSKDFKQKHFDSYRNTYVGFIFQEYNVLQDFSVGANIALALELQGKKATDEEINKILYEVDLAGHGNRRPNELSGGQKQRVAIARALVKHPKIIMADEPTGALDSATGKQVFDTLKKLSADKLVIVVSHDRDFAAKYADRIIELADGKVISDVTICENKETATEQAGISFEGNTAKIPMDYRLTEEDRLAINAYMDKLNSGVELTIADAKANQTFIPTDQNEIRYKDTTPFKLIKSKLSLKHAFKIGGSGLKHKKFRLVMTILLSCVAFIMFGLADTFSAYNHVNATANSILDTGITYASLTKCEKTGEGENAYWDRYDVKLSKNDISELSQKTGISFNGVIGYGNFSFRENLNQSTALYNDFNPLVAEFYGMAEITPDIIDQMDYRIVAGVLPDGTKNEIAISAYIFEAFKKCGYKSFGEEIEDKSSSVNVTAYNDMIGKTLCVGGVQYTVTAVIDTGFDFDRYKPLFETNYYKDDNQIVNFILLEELRCSTEYSYTGLMMLGDGRLENIINEKNMFVTDDVASIYMMSTDYMMQLYLPAVTTLSNVDRSSIKWLGNEKQLLDKDEIIITSAVLEQEYYAVDYDASGELVLETDKLQNTAFQLFCDSRGTSIRTSELKVVGVIDSNKNSNIYREYAVVSDAVFDAMPKNTDSYEFALGAMPKTKGDIKKLVSFCYDESGNVKYEINNPVSFELDSLNELLKALANVFLYIGIGFAIFAAILLSNFIATSISYKKQEIGILRAIGSRSNDVFRIFFAESFIIAMINFVLSLIGVYTVTAVINNATRTNLGALITVLDVGIRQIGLLFIISIGVAAVASFLPVKKIASKKPIDAIKNT